MSIAIGAGRPLRAAIAAFLISIAGCGNSAAVSPVELRPEQFGAAGDGRTDDTAAFQRALGRLAAAGGGAIVGRPGATYRITSGIDLRRLSNVELRGNGATMFRYTPGTASNALSLYGSENVLIEGWSFDSSYDGFARGSTGSNPNIFLGVDGSRPNRNIVIRGNRFNNGNHANITVGTTGISAKLPARGFANENVRIEDNWFQNAGAAVFVYKATRGFFVLRNEGRNFSVGAVGVDTHAASDRDTVNYTIERGEIRSNSFRNIVAARVPWNPGQGFAARGLVLKGGIHDVLVADNQISGIRSITNVDTFGILITKDQAPKSAAGSALTIANNSIEDVSAAAPGATAAWALVLGPGHSAVVIKDNIFKGAERGVRLSAGSSWSFLSNRLENLSLSTSFPLEIDPSSASDGRKTVDGNTLVRGRSRLVQGIHAPRGVPNLAIGRNELVGYPVGIR